MFFLTTKKYRVLIEGENLLMHGEDEPQDHDSRLVAALAGGDVRRP